MENNKWTDVELSIFWDSGMGEVCGAKFYSQFRNLCLLYGRALINTYKLLFTH